MAAPAHVIAQLRERIDRMQAAPRPSRRVLPTGVGEIDALLGGGLLRSGAVELCGEAASGCATIALRAVATATGQGELAAWVDGPGQLYPPAAVALGVRLSRLLIVRPRQPHQWAWSAVQLARSGAFACVVLDGASPAFRLDGVQGRKLLDAAERGGTALVLLTRREAPAAGMARLWATAQGAQGVLLQVARGAHGQAGRAVLLAWEALHPAPLAGRYLEAFAPSEGGLVPRFVRPERHGEREGYGGLHQGRPGRDAPPPSLAPSLGVL